MRLPLVKSEGHVSSPDKCILRNRRCDHLSILFFCQKANIMYVFSAAMRRTKQTHTRRILNDLRTTSDGNERCMDTPRQLLPVPLHPGFYCAFGQTLDACIRQQVGRTNTSFFTGSTTFLKTKAFLFWLFFPEFKGLGGLSPSRTKKDNSPPPPPLMFQ